MTRHLTRARTVFVLMDKITADLVLAVRMRTVDRAYKSFSDFITSDDFDTIAVCNGRHPVDYWLCVSRSLTKRGGRLEVIGEL